MTDLEKNIRELRESGKTCTEIRKLLKCSKTMVYYYLTDGQRDKVLKRKKECKKKRHPFICHLENFLRQKRGNGYKNINDSKRFKIKFFGFQRKRKVNMPDYNKYGIEDVIQKIGDRPTCYLTGLSIDVEKPSTYSFDHIIPVSRGGSNGLDNLGICLKQANFSKHDMTPDEYFNLCKLVLEHNGYTVTKNNTNP